MLPHEVADVVLEGVELVFEVRRDGGEMGIVVSRDQEEVRVGDRCVIGDDVEVAALVEQVVHRLVSVAEGAIAVVEGALVGHTSMLHRKQQATREATGDKRPAQARRTRDWKNRGGSAGMDWNAMVLGGFVTCVKATLGHDAQGSRYER